MSENDIGFVSIKEPKTNWYPAYQVRGEGIFIEFNDKEIIEWIESHPEVQERANKININYANSYIGKVILEILQLNLLCYIPFHIY